MIRVRFSFPDDRPDQVLIDFKLAPFATEKIYYGNEAYIVARSFPNDTGIADLDVELEKYIEPASDVPDEILEKAYRSIIKSAPDLPMKVIENLLKGLADDGVLPREKSE